MNAKLLTGEMLAEDAIETTARDGVEHAAQFGVTAETEEEKSKGFAVMLGEAKDTAVSLARMHHRSLAPLIEPIAVEEPFEMEVDGTDDLKLVGVIDLLTRTRITQDPANDELRLFPNGDEIVRDTKSAAKRKPQSDADSSLQLSMYALERESVTGRRPLLALDVMVATKTPRVQVLETTRTDDQIAALWNRIDMVVKMLRAGIFPPAPPTAWNCSERWCGYYKTCPFAGGARRTIVG